MRLTVIIVQLPSGNVRLKLCPEAPEGPIHKPVDKSLTSNTRDDIKY